MPSATYRYHRLDREGRLHHPATIAASDDAAAVHFITAKFPGDTCEVWRDRELVAKIGPDPNYGER